MKNNRLIYIFSGCTGCGKTSLSKPFATEHGMTWTSFGDAVRAEAKLLGLEPTDKETLQKLGQRLVEHEQNRLCDIVLSQIDFGKDNDCVIDGLRHIRIYELLKQKLSPEYFRLIYINTETGIRHGRLVKNRGVTYSQCYQFDADPTEIEVESQLRPLADLIVDNNGSMEEAKSTIENWFGAS